MIHLKICFVLLVSFFCLSSQYNLDASSSIQSDVVNPGSPLENERQRIDQIDFTDDSPTPRRRGPHFRNVQGKRWPNGVIPYTLEKITDEKLKLTVLDVIRDYDNYTCIKWIPKTEEHKDYVTFTQDNGPAAGSSHVGFFTDPSYLIVNFNYKNKGLVAHEMMHRIGFKHEHQRSDRDDHMDMYYHHMLRASDELNTPGSIDPIKPLPYDYRSAVQYPSWMVGQGTPAHRYYMRAKDPCLYVGQDEGYTKMDFMKMNKYYNCPASTLPENFLDFDGNKPKYDLSTEWVDGTTLFKCVMEDAKENERAVPNAVGSCFEQKEGKFYKEGEEFLVGGHKCRCDISKDRKEAKIYVLNGCESFSHEQWTNYRYAHNYECDKNENKLVHRIVGCSTPINWGDTAFVPNGTVRNGEEIEKGYFCKIYANGTRARTEKRK